MTKDQIFEFFRRLAEDNPEPETELEYGNAYQLVVAVALSAQATDVGVNKATRALFAKVETPQQMLDLGLEGLIEHMKTKDGVWFGTHEEAARWVREQAGMPAM